MATEMPAWHEIRMLVARELDDPVHDARPLTPPRTSRMTWAARAQRTGPIVVKARRGDNAPEKTQWCAKHLPVLGARGYPVPTMLWHGMISAEWHVTVQNRLPGRPLSALDGPMLDAALRLVDGLDLVEPGVVQASHWRPGPGTAVPESQMWCGLGRKAG